MIATINALESKLAVRGHISSGMQSQNIVPAVRLAKAFNEPVNKALASDKLDAFLSSNAIPLQKELELLANYVVLKTPGAKYIPGPLKTLKKALGKTQEDYDFAWTMNKDLVRGTVVC